ncbi:MAG TPA: amidohydrolase family protein, partial [Deinococcales bacterium]|nr:amidohydrolase family protein [Deinococcales bacterium]
YTPFNETWLEVNLLVDRVGLTPLEALRSATVNAAAALKLETVTGRAAQGFRADLIAVRGSPLDNPAVLSDVPWVMRRGEITKGAVTA